MTANIGTIDRVLRAVIGIVLLALAVSGWVGPWAYIGMVPLLTAMFGMCPLYRVLGVSTCTR